MQLYKCGKLMMKIVSPLKVGLILFFLFGAISALNWSPSLKPPIHKVSSLPRASPHNFTRTSSSEESTSNFSLRKASYKHFKITTVKPVFAPKVFLILSAHEYNSQASDKSREYLDSPMFTKGNPYKTENRNPRRRKNGKKRLRSRKRIPNQRAPSKRFLDTDNFRNHPLKNEKQKYFSRQREEVLHFETVTNPYDLLKSTKRKPTLGKRVSNPLIEYKSANNFQSYKNLDAAPVNESQFSNIQTNQTVIYNPYKSIKRKGKSYDTGSIKSREDTVDFKEYDAVIENVTNLTKKPDKNNRKLSDREKLINSDSKIDIQDKPIDQNKKIIKINEKLSFQDENIDSQEKLFNYTYQISALERGSLYPHDPFSDIEISNITSPISNYNNASNFYKDYYFSNFASKPKNITIYELLKPRLKTAEHSKDLQKLSLSRGDEYSRFYSQIENTTAGEITDGANYKTLSDTTLVYETKDKFKYQTSVSSSSVSYELDKSTEEPRIKVREKVLPSDQNKPSVLSRKIPDSVINSNLYRHKFNKTFLNNWWLNSYKPQTLDDALQVMTNLSEKFQNKPAVLNSTTILSIQSKNINNTTPPSTIPVTTIPVTTIPVTLSSSDSITDLENADSIREAKMADSINPDNIALKNPKIDPKTFYEYFMKSNQTKISKNPTGSEDYRPGGIFRYSDIFRRQPVLGGFGVTRQTPFFGIRPQTFVTITEVPDTTPTMFESLRTTTSTMRVMSTFYPNRMRDVTMRFATVPDSSATVPNLLNKDLGHSGEEGTDESEFRDAIEPGFTMEKLAFLLIGTCCGLSILCLCVVVIAIKCRRVFQEKKFKEHFRRRMYQHEALKDASSPWQQQIYDHFAYLNRHPESSRSSAHSCNCHCVTWTLGPRNLEGTKPLFGHNNRNSTFMGGQKKLPFGAASTLRYESMMGRKRASSGMAPGMTQMRHEPPVSDSTPENDSLEQPDSDSRDSDVPRHCTCVDYTMWPISTDVLRGMNRIYPATRHYIAGDCSQHGIMDERPLPRDYPPPVTGSNYLDRSEGVVYWSSNNERLI